jgi:hypothetical protein
VNPQVADQVIVFVHPGMGQRIEHRLQQVVEVSSPVVWPECLDVYL